MAGRRIKVSKKIFASYGSGKKSAVPITSAPETVAAQRVVRCAGCFSAREIPTDFRRPCESCGRYATTTYEEKQMRNVWVEEY